MKTRSKTNRQAKTTLGPSSFWFVRALPFHSTLADWQNSTELQKTYTAVGNLPTIMTYIMFDSVAGTNGTCWRMVAK